MIQLGSVEKKNRLCSVHLPRIIRAKRIKKRPRYFPLFLSCVGILKTEINTFQASGEDERGLRAQESFGGSNVRRRYRAILPRGEASQDELIDFPVLVPFFLFSFSPLRCNS